MTEQEQKQVEQMKAKMATLPNGGREIIQKKIASFESRITITRKSIQENLEDIKIVPASHKAQVLGDIQSAKELLEKDESMLRVLRAVM